MKNKFLLLPYTLLVVGLMTISVPFEGRAQDKFENLRKVWNGANQEPIKPKSGKEEIKNVTPKDAETSKYKEDRKIDSSRKAEEELEQQIDAVYEAGLKLKEDIKKAEAERDGFNGAGMSPERAEAKYYELDVKCLELRSQYEILVLELEELQEEYAKLIGD